MVGAKADWQVWLAMEKAMLTWQKGLTLRRMAVELSSLHHFSSDGLLLPLVTTTATTRTTTATLDYYGVFGRWPFSPQSGTDAGDIKMIMTRE